MKAAISVPDDLFEHADRVAERLGKSRSQLYAEAMAEYLDRHDPDTVTDRLDEVLEALGDENVNDGFVNETARSILEQVEW